MKRLLVVLSVAAFVLSAAPAMAQKSMKPPKSICLNIQGYSLTFTMATAKGGTTVVSGEKLALIDIQGSLKVVSTNYPLHGSGYVKGNNLNFTFTSVYGSTNTITVSVQGVWNLATGTGTAIWSTMGPGIGGSQGSGNLLTVDCSTFTVPSEIESDELSAEALFGDFEL